MNFKKSFNYEDINNFLPDNLTIGSSEYYREKFHNSLPEYMCDILEIKTRVNHK